MTDNARDETLALAAEELCSEIEQTEDHGTGAHEDGCGICRGIASVRAALRAAPPREALEDDSVTRAFEIGYSWGQQVHRPAVCDSRDVCRTLASDLFKDYGVNVDVSSVPGFASRDDGIFHAKQAILAALRAAPPATDTEEWALRLLNWCRPRLKLAHQGLLDKYLAEGPKSAPQGEPKIVASAHCEACGGTGMTRWLGQDNNEEVGECQECRPAPDTPVGERRTGHSKLVYNKATRTIDTVRTDPATDTGMREALEAFVRFFKPTLRIADEMHPDLHGYEDADLVADDDLPAGKISYGDLRRARAAMARPPQVADTREGRQFLHVKTGSRYTEITRGMLQGESSVVIYRSDAEGSLWIRPESEFDDGRFVEIPSASVPVSLSVVEKCARVAEMFSINKTAIHPDVAWDAMSQQAQHVAHMTCQNVAEAIRALASGADEKGRG